MTPSGPMLFARFAYPPNELGYCGPEDARGLLERVTAGADEAGLRDAATRFDGAWPYLRLIAAANHIPDPLDRRVVEAYWIGNDLLSRVDARLLGESLATRFGKQAGARWDRLVAPVSAGARPHHNFHVFAVYPWLGLIRSGVVDQPLRVLDRCRIRWGRVDLVDADRVRVTGQQLEWDGLALVLGAPRAEEVIACRDGMTMTPAVHPGQWCALHWDWICTPLSDDQVRRLRRWTDRTLRAVNAMPYPAPAAVLS